MLRPLIYKTAKELREMTDQNLENRQQLELILSELRPRNTAAAKKIMADIKLRLQIMDEEHEPPIDNDKEPQSIPESKKDKGSKSKVWEIVAEKDDLVSEHQKPVPDEVRDWTETAIAALRAKLIDLSRRSPLISFKHGARSASQLRIVDELPDLLFEALSERGMGFEALPGEEKTPPDEQTPQFSIAYERARLVDEEFRAATAELSDEETDSRAWQDAERALRARVREDLGLPKLDYGKQIDVKEIARAHGFDPSYDLKDSDDGEIAEHHEDDDIRVLLIRKELDKRLKTLWDRARMHERETGLHTLFLSFGFIQWYEDDASDRINHAPLLLLPVKLDREVKRGRYVYKLTALDDGMEVNVALIEKARTDWGIDLPKLRDGETPESYFIRARMVEEQGMRLSIRNFATLAVLPPMVLWKDLDPSNWPKDAFARHRLLPGLVGAAEMAGGDNSGDMSSGLSQAIDIDAPEWENKLPALVCDADASQHSAIIDMKAGKDLAIEGPPGTGKSQTITNMIAAALAEGKKILFVAEKQAALDVVANRLRAAGFGSLLMELHGSKANRTEVYANLKNRIEQRGRLDERKLEEKRGELLRHRRMLRGYLALIGKEIGRLEMPAYSLAWREITLRRQFEPELIELLSSRWTPVDPIELTRAELTENRELLDQFGAALTSLSPDSSDSDRGDRTYWLLANKLDAFDQNGALKLAAELGKAAQAVAAAETDLVEEGLSMPGPNGDLNGAAEYLSKITNFPHEHEESIKALLNVRQDADLLIDCQRKWQSLCADLVADLKSPETVTKESCEALLQASNLSAWPKSFTDLQTQQESADRLVGALSSTEHDQQRLIAELRADSNMPIGQAHDVICLCLKLGELPQELTIFLQQKLLDPLANTVIASSMQEQTALTSERDQLSGLFSAEAFEMEPSELDGLAVVAEDTGLAGRVFSPTYRATKRRIKRLMGEFGDRLETAASLREMAAYIRGRDHFKSDNKIKYFFPDLVWNGIDSDIASLSKAREVLTDTHRDLAALDEADMLRSWLALAPHDREAFIAALRRLKPVFDEAISAGLREDVLGDLPRVAGERLFELSEAKTALAGVGARPECRLEIEGETLALRLKHLHNTHEEYNRLREQELLNFAGDIVEPLDVLEQNRQHLEKLESLKDPFWLPTILKSKDAPAQSLDRILEVKSLWLSAISRWQDNLGNLLKNTGLDAALLDQGPGWSAIAEKLSAMSIDREGAAQVANLLKYRANVNGKGLSSLADMSMKGEVDPTKLADAYEMLAVRSLLRHYLGGDGEELSRLGGLTLDQARTAFRKTDAELHELEAKAILANRLQDTVPQGHGYGRKSDYSDFALIQHEVNLKRPRTPMRDVVRRASKAMLALQPVWMMSPASAAQYIAAGTLHFDLLVVDEASQMRPEFAVSSILRADQFIVVGDANQLPPSDHFKMGTADTDDDADAVGVDENTESILDLANQKFRQKRRLKWHYRSQHESLIHFSNRNFYDSDLIIFPSPLGNDDELLGVKCRYAPDIYPDTAYEASINQREAQVVIEEAFGLMRSHPERSIGIVAMNSKQTDLIKNEFDRLILEEPDVQNYVEAFNGGLDEFFIKNLENVQGDERDIILISTVYGPDQDGKVRQNFGLMNREVGWRRLNVLVTRAKLSCRLITSLRPNDIKVTENSSKGVVAFKGYLTYAHQGAQYEDATGGEPDSDFEIFVADALRDAGYEVVYQVGVEGFRIDLGVRHKDCPIGFVAGIECDGAPYHTGLSVRDRDRIRQSVLEGLGWSIYRVWSTDWFADSHRETLKLLTWLEGRLNNLRASIASLEPQNEIDPPVYIMDGEPDNATGEITKRIEENGESVVPQPGEPAATEEEITPTGELMRSLGNFEWYAATRGRLYQIWSNKILIGEVEVIHRATESPKLYGDRAVTARSEYEGRVIADGDCFKSYDLYAAVREVAKRAKDLEID